MEAIAPHRRVAGRHVLQQAIGGGVIASVWEAVEEVLARSVAMKTLRSDLAEDSVLSGRFQTGTINLPLTAVSGLLIWIVALGPDRGRFAASIADVTVSGPG